VGNPTVNSATGEVQVRYEFPEPGAAEAYGEVAEGATVARVHGPVRSVPWIGLFDGPPLAGEIGFPVVPEAVQAKAKSAKCAKGFVKRGSRCVGSAPVRYGLLKLAIATAGTYSFTIKPSAKVLAALKKGRTIATEIVLVFTPAGTSAHVQLGSSVRLHLKLKNKGRASK
jgi:hypothetical protein